jgi:hypothetical protein
LVTGGGNADPGIILATTGLYDPDLSSFSPLPEMILTRMSHTATLLPDGTVLIAGGASYQGYDRADLRWLSYLSSVELYRPATRSFSEVGFMTAGRYGHTATLLTDGRVLIAGGIGAPEYSSLATTEVYNPSAFKPAPTLLSLSGDGRGQGAILHANTHQFATSNNPASVEEALEIYSTGLGDGSQIPPQVSIGGRMAEVLWFGNTPGYVGLNQVNVRVPNGVAPGSAVPVRLTYIGRPSSEVTIGVR